MADPNYIIDTGKEPRIIHNLKNIRDRSKRKLCKIDEIKKQKNDMYFPQAKDNQENVDYYINNSPINGHSYTRCFFCNQTEL
jgi:hypothetical protein